MSEQFALGEMYAKGSGVPRDYAQAVQWYRKAAEQGYVTAVFCLGVSHDYGTGMPKDDIEAYKWYDLASALSEGTVQKLSAEDRDLVAKWMTRAQIAEAQKRAREWVAAFERRQKQWRKGAARAGLRCFIIGAWRRRREARLTGGHHGLGVCRFARGLHPVDGGLSPR